MARQYTSYIFVRPSDGTTYVFWLNSTVREKHWAFNGPKPIPEIVLHTVETELNVAWGHVAHFQIVGQNLEIMPNQHYVPRFWANHRPYGNNMSG